MTSIATRTARASDVVHICKLLQAMHSETEGALPLDLKKMVDTVVGLMAGDGVKVALRDGVIVGVIGLHGMSPWYSSSRLITDCFIYVTPEARNIKAFAALIREAKAYAAKWKSPLQICLWTLTKTTRKAKLFERHGRRIMHGYLFQELGGAFDIAA